MKKTATDLFIILQKMTVTALLGATVFVAGMFIFVVGPIPSAHARVGPGDILVAIRGRGTNNQGVLFRFHPSTGNGIMLSDFGDPAQGPRGNSPAEVALEASGDILVVDRQAGTNTDGALFRVDSTGFRILLSDFGNPAQGPRGKFPSGVAVEASGDILVVDEAAGTNGRGALFRVDSSTGFRTVLSDFGDSTLGALGEFPVGVAVEASGDILVVDRDAGTNGRGVLFRVDPLTGFRTVLSDFGDSTLGALGEFPVGVAVEASGDIVVTDFLNFTPVRVNPITGIRTVLNNSIPSGHVGVAVVPPNPADIFVVASGDGISVDGALFKVHPSNGTRELRSDFGDSTQGPLGVFISDVAIDSLDNILVIDQSGGTTNLGALFSVDPVNGNRSILSDFGQGSPALQGALPLGVAIETSGDIVVTDADAGTSSQGALFRVNPSNGNRTVLSDFGDSLQGVLGADPLEVAIDGSGNILVVDVSTRKLIRVNSSTGFRSEMSTFTDSPGGVAVGSSGEIAVAVFGFSSGAVFSVDPVTGTPSLISDFSNAAQGPPGVPSRVAIEGSGDILAVGSGALFRVDPITGDRTLLSGFGDPAQGPLGVGPRGVAVVPDEDNDGISTAVDTSPTFSNDFSDNPGGGATTTTGTITSRGNQTLFTTEAPNPDGVRVKVVASLGPIPATVSSCGGVMNNMLDHDPTPDEVIVTCTSAKTEVTHGVVPIELFGNDGTVATLTLGEGNSITFDPTDSTYTAPSTNDPVVVLVDGVEITVEPGVTLRPVNVDIKPDGDPNCIKETSKGRLPVAILGNGFDVTTINVSTLEIDGVTSTQSRFKDVSGDGNTDLLLKFKMTELLGAGSLGDGDPLVVTGELTDGTKIFGSDVVFFAGGPNCN